MTDHATPDPHVLLGLARSAALEAGALIFEALHRQRSTVDTKSTGTDMVTEMDRAAEALVVDRIRAERPDDGFLGEEGAADAGTTGVRWVIDPIDGTTNYLYRLPAFAVSIAAESGGITVAGVVHNPALGETYAAVKGGGSTLNGAALRSGGARDLANALVATGFGYDAFRRTRQAEIVARVIGHVRDIRRFGSAALDLCSVAAGRADAYFERGCQAWDLAAGTLIAREAGALAGDLAGGEPCADMALAAAPHLFEPLRELLLDAGAGADY